MQQIIYRQILTILTIFLLFNSCSLPEKDNSIAEKTVITGRIVDYEQLKTKITIINNDLCVKEKREILEIDSFGYFYYSFISNSKRDLRIKSNRANFLVLAFPGDSVYVEFKSRNKEFWNHIRFGGDRATENTHITGFQKTFQDQSVNYEKISQQKAVLNENKFIEFMDSVQTESMKIVDSFRKQKKMTETELNWINWYASEPYYYNMFWYPVDKGIEVSTDYYGFQDKFLSLLSNDMAATYNIDLYIGEYFSGSIKPKFFKDNQQLIEKLNSNGGYNEKLEHTGDSLLNEAILKYTDGEIAKQLVLTYWYAAKIRNGYLKSFESFEPFLMENISIDFLRNSLFDYYNEIKTKNELTGSEMVKKIQNKALMQILDSIFISKKGDVIVFDCWTTWCGPCIANFSKMNNLIKELDKQPISFVFFCLDGSKNKNRWKDLIKTHSVKGIHYCLNEQEADELRKIFDIGGVPHHIIFDNKGRLRKNGNIHIDKNELSSMINE